MHEQTWYFYFPDIASDAFIPRKKVLSVEKVVAEVLYLFP